MVKSHKTRKTRRHNKSKRKSLRRVHKRRQTKRKHGGNNMNINDHCHMYRDKLNDFRNRLQDITLNTYEDLSNDVKNMYDEALRAGCKNEADALELFENNELYPRIDELHQ
jgi:hypothetical protein